MYVYDALTPQQIADRLLADPYASWTYEQARALAAWLFELAESTGEPIEFDRTAVRLEWAAYTAAELVDEYGEDPHAVDDVDEIAPRVAARLQDEGRDVINCDDGTYLMPYE